MSGLLPPMLVNGQATSTVSACDRGLLYGDGVFETIAVADGKVQLWELHMARLQLGCQRLGMAPVDSGMLAAEAAALCRHVTRAVVKIIITRGAGGRGYRPSASATQTRIVQLYPWPDYPERFAREGIRLRICTMRMGHNTALAGIKHLNRLEQVLARAEWDDEEIPEGLLLDQQGLLVEGTMSNIFLVCGKKLVTPDLTQCGVAGVMRATVIELAAGAGISAELRSIPLEELYQAQEVFVCNSLIGIWPVSCIGNRSITTGNVTRQLQGLLLIQSEARG
jgi:4-amino-4-deoxychorismate lyase